LAELAPPRVSDTLQFFIDLLAAVPSVIYGLLAVFIVVPLMRTVIYPALNKPFGYLPIFKGTVYGVGFMTAGIVLAIMVIPYIIRCRAKFCFPCRATSGAALALGSRDGIDLEGGVPFAKDGHHGLDFSGAGPCPGRNHGGDYGDRQHAQDCGFLFAPGYSIAAVIANEFTEATAICICSR